MRPCATGSRRLSADANGSKKGRRSSSQKCWGQFVQKLKAEALWISGSDLEEETKKREEEERGRRKRVLSKLWQQLLKRCEGVGFL